MDGILKALGFESRPEYNDKIPETLTPEDFEVHKVRKSGVQQILYYRMNSLSSCVLYAFYPILLNFRI